MLKPKRSSGLTPDELASQIKERLGIINTPIPPLPKKLSREELLQGVRDDVSVVTERVKRFQMEVEYGIP